MKMFLSVLLVLCLLCPAALADPDLSAMTVEELTQLRDRISLELADRAASASALGVWETSLARVELLSVTRGTTDDGRPGLDCLFSYTNLGSEVDKFRAHHWVTLYHDGVECETTIRLDGRLINNETWSSKVFPGRTLPEMHWFFVLSGTEDTVVIEVEDRTSRSWASAGYVTVRLPE